ncbi:MAG: hypothetical protein OEW08_14240 [Gammaproteobacteria bacterium]|nr:hypothetical protein [Gammaproteobacteria bacterium]
MHSFGALVNKASLELNYAFLDTLEFFAKVDFTTMEANGKQRGDYAVPTQSGVTWDEVGLQNQMHQYNVLVGMRYNF